jgi:hypothetical protein
MVKLRDDWDNATSASRPVNGFERPPRVEDRIPVHRNPRDGRPQIWLPDGSKAIYYSRPSSWGKKVEDQTNLSKWETRVTLSGYLDFGEQSRALRAERSALGPSEDTSDSKKAHNDLNERAKGLVSTADRVGTALHTITERDDLGLPVNPGDDFRADLEEWRRLTRHFQIATMPNGDPGVECFVATDIPRFNADGSPVINTYGYHDHVRLAGTFDRLWIYKPCMVVIDEKTGEKCGRRKYIGDLKSGKLTSVDYNGLSWAVQEAVYRAGKQYVPWSDGQGADRFDLDDVCPHVAITLSLPAGSGKGTVIWTNIAQGHSVAEGLVPAVKDARKMKNWFVPFEPVPDLYAAIDACRSVSEIRKVWRENPSEEWYANDQALINHADHVAKMIESGGVIG